MAALKVSTEWIRSMDRSLKSGWLTKQGKLARNWKKRWFILTQHQLYYFKSQKESEQQGQCPTYKCKVEITGSNTFTVTADTSFGGRKYFLKADTEAAMKMQAAAPEAAGASSGGRSKLFGGSIDEAVRMNSNAVAVENPNVPHVVVECTKFIEKHGIDSEGIYRLSGGSNEVAKIKAMFEQDPNATIEEFADPNAVANVLKRYFRELSDPLLTFDAYSDFAGVGAKIQGPQRLEALKMLCQRLPSSNFATCLVLMRHLKAVAEYAKENYMHTSNLALVFAPNILRPAEESMAGMVTDSGSTMGVVQAMIDDVEDIFGTAPPPIPSKPTRAQAQTHEGQSLAPAFPPPSMSIAAPQSRQSQNLMQPPPMPGQRAQSQIPPGQAQAPPAIPAHPTRRPLPAAKPSWAQGQGQGQGQTPPDGVGIGVPPPFKMKAHGHAVAFAAGLANGGGGGGGGDQQVPPPPRQTRRIEEGTARQVNQMAAAAAAAQSLEPGASTAMMRRATTVASTAAVAECSHVVAVAKAIYPWKPRRAQEIPLQPGDVVHVLKRDPNGWWRGQVVGADGSPSQSGEIGLFPANYCTVTKEGPPSPIPELSSTLAPSLPPPMLAPQQVSPAAVGHSAAIPPPLDVGIGAPPPDIAYLPPPLDQDVEGDTADSHAPSGDGLGLGVFNAHDKDEALAENESENEQLRGRIAELEEELWQANETIKALQVEVEQLQAEQWGPAAEAAGHRHSSAFAYQAPT